MHCQYSRCGKKSISERPDQEFCDHRCRKQAWLEKNHEKPLAELKAMLGRLADRCEEIRSTTLASAELESELQPAHELLKKLEP